MRFDVYRDGQRIAADVELDRVPWRDEAVALAVKVMDLTPDQLMDHIASTKANLVLELRQEDGTRWEVKVGLRLVGEVSMFAEVGGIRET